MSKIIDERENDRLVKQLIEFGLKVKEAQVYLALLPRKDTGSSKLVLATGLHKQFVYNSLARLEELGLARHVIQKGRKKFSANTPLRLMSLIEEKRLAVQSVAKELQNRYSGAREQDFEVFQGEEAFIAHQMELLDRAPEESMIDVIASETEQYMKTFEDYGMAEEFEKKRVEKNISVRYIGSEAQAPRLLKMEKERELWTHKILPGHSTGITSTDIWSDNITLSVFGNPLLTFTLTGKEIADGYHQFFDTIWKLTERKDSNR